MPKQTMTVYHIRMTKKMYDTIARDATKEEVSWSDKVRDIISAYYHYKKGAK